MDTFSELIGFLIVVLVLIFPLLRRFLEKKAIKAEQEREEEKPPQLQPKKEAKKRSLVPQHIPPRPRPHESSFHYSLEDYKRTSSIESRTIETHIHPHFEDHLANKKLEVPIPVQIVRKSRLERVLENKTSAQKMIIFQEMMNKPRSLSHD